MRIPLLVFPIYFLALESRFSEGQHNRKDAVVCSDSQSSLTLRCDDDEVLRIHNAVYAHMSGRFACAESIIPNIKTRERECKQGSLLPRCEGERVCTIEQSEVAQRLENQNCCKTIQECTTNTLHINYYCEKVRKVNSTVAVLQLPQRDVTGKSLRVRSPSYPNNMPSQLKTLSCRVAAESALTSNQPVLLKLGLFVTFNPSEEECAEKLTFDFTRRSDPIKFCIQNGETQRNARENYPVMPLARKLFEFTYSKSFSAEGGTFVLDIKAFQSGEPVDLKMSCKDQEDFTVMTTVPTLRLTSSVLSPSLSPRSQVVSVPPTVPKPLDVNRTDGSRRGYDVKDPSTELEKESTKESNDSMLIWIVVGVVVGVVITAGVIAVCVAYRVRKRRQENKNGRRMELVATAPEPTLIPSPESVAIYSVARDIDEDVQNGNLTQQEVDDVSHMYAVVDKSRKTKAKSKNESNVVNDVMSADNGDVIMCENDELYDATSRGEDNRNRKKDVSLTRDTDSVIMFENTELYSQQ